MLKTIGFVIRVPIPYSWIEKQNITTKITKNTKKYFKNSFLNFVSLVVYITAFRIAVKIQNGALTNISKRN